MRESTQIPRSKKAKSITRPRGEAIRFFGSFYSASISPWDSATRQVTDYEQRFSVLKDAYDGLLVNLIKSGFNPKEAWETAKEFFGSESIRFAGIDGKCSQHVETLLRQGRTYGLGVCIATQRIAYLNTNALQQLHTYFVGTLPRPYDRDW